MGEIKGEEVGETEGEVLHALEIKCCVHRDEGRILSHLNQTKQIACLGLFHSLV